MKSRSSIMKDRKAFFELLETYFPIENRSESLTNFLFFDGLVANLIANMCEAAGVGVRRLGQFHGFNPDACRVAIPTIEEISEVEQLLKDNAGCLV